MKPINQQTILITGATDGLGRAIAAELARNGAALLLHGRNEERGRATVKRLRTTAPGASLTFYRADFASLAEVRRMAEEIRREQSGIDVLVNNAGVYNDERMESQDGLELAFQVNYLAHVLLTRELLPLLKAAAPSRIVNVASAGQEEIDFDDLMLERRYEGGVSYRRSKLAQIMFTLDLAEQLRGNGITVNTLHPATYMPTKMVTGRFPPTNSVEDGVDATMRLITSKEVEDVTGGYFYMQRKDRALAQAYDDAARRRLREATDRLLNAGTGYRS